MARRSSAICGSRSRRTSSTPGKDERSRSRSRPTSPARRAAASWSRSSGATGRSWRCPGYPECKHTQPLDDSELPVPVEGTCPLCGAGLVARTGPLRALHPLLAPAGVQVHQAVHARRHVPEVRQGRASPRSAASAARCSTRARATRSATTRCGTGPRPMPCPNGAAPRSWSRRRRRSGLDPAVPEVQGACSRRTPSVRDALERFLIELATRVAPRPTRWPPTAATSPACSTWPPGAGSRWPPPTGRASCSSARCATSTAPATPPPARRARWRPGAAFVALLRAPRRDRARSRAHAGVPAPAAPAAAHAAASST